MAPHSNCGLVMLGKPRRRHQKLSSPPTGGRLTGCSRVTPVNKLRALPIYSLCGMWVWFSSPRRRVTHLFEQERRQRRGRGQPGPSVTAGVEPRVADDWPVGCCWWASPASSSSHGLCLAPPSGESLQRHADSELLFLCPPPPGMGR